MKMKFDFVTNSSSTHHIVKVNKVIREPYDSGQEFAWNEFILSSKESKLNYLIQIIHSNLEYEPMGDYECERICKELDIDIDIDFDGYIDHQSYMEIPTNSNNQLDMEILKKLKDFILRDDIIIVGGNDNDDCYKAYDLGEMVWETDGFITELLKMEGEKCFSE